MFEPSDKPRLFALPPGADFAAELVAGLRARLKAASPHAMGRVTLVVNTRRTERRLRSLFESGPPMLPPKVHLVTDLAALPGAGLPPAPAASPLRRRLELARLIRAAARADPGLAPRGAVFDLADSLANLLDEMQGEGVDMADLRALDLGEQSEHWARSLAFIGIVDTYLAATGDTPDPAGRQRALAVAIAETWKANPPPGPVIVAGSTGSRGATQLLMRAVAALPQGAVLLPGYDFDLPESVWQGMGDPLISEDHPQYRFHSLMQALGLTPADIGRWTDTPAPSPERNRLISLALRPAPVTDAWMQEGPVLAGLAEATEKVTLVEAPSPRAEAQAIALRLRQAAEDGQKAALITPNRMLSRRVAAALDLWGILPDDSAGQPLQLSLPGRFLRHVAGLFTERLSAEALLILLKHPITHSENGRGPHLLATRDLELHLRRNGPPFPTPASLAAYGEGTDLPEGWADWAIAAFAIQEVKDPLPLTAWVARLMALAELIARGTAPDGTGQLWTRSAGEEARAVMARLEEDAGYGGEMPARDFADILGRVLATGEVRESLTPDPRVMIWGTLEARVQGADLLILAGLNENEWPEAAAPDPWLNRRMRAEAGLLLPDRNIGLSAHDFQQAAGAQEVWLTRATQSDDAQTVPARWMNRLTNLLGGLPDNGGVAALKGMRARGEHWLARVDAFEVPHASPPAQRPAPRPPVNARPDRLSVTRIKQLIRNPYEIYARYVLRLEELDPIRHEPDAKLRGILLHDVFHTFIDEVRAHPDRLTETNLMELAREELEGNVPWPTIRRLWLAKLARIAPDFIAGEEARRLRGTPLKLEANGEARLTLPDFTLTARADRIDRAQDGRLILYDYKTGTPPSRASQASFDLQLLLEAAMAEQGAFKPVAAGVVDSAEFIGIGSRYQIVAAPLDDHPAAQVWADFHKLIARYASAEQGFTARLYPFREGSEDGPYDHLARFGEWDRSDEALPEDVS